MNKFNNIPISDYGLKLVAYQGIFNMPKRTGEVVYNWGDELQPIVTGLTWEAHEFTMQVFFDSRLTDKTFSETINTLKGLDDVLLSTDYGNFDVKIKEIREAKKYGLFTILFHQRQPNFTATLGAATGGNLTIDGYDLDKDFGVKVIKTHPFEQAGELFPLNETTYQTPQALSSLRQFSVLKIDCIIPFSTHNEVSTAVGKLKHILSKEGMRKVKVEGVFYDAFFTEGFTASFVGNSLKFTLSLWIASIDAATLHALQYLIAYSKIEGLTWESVGCTAETIRRAAGISDGKDALYFKYKAVSIIDNLTWESPRCTYNSLL